MATSPPDRGVPGSTYRVQFHQAFTFRHALECVDYWDSLGITHIYAAPFLTARRGSVHGYDVVDPRTVNPEIGGEEGLARLHEALAGRGMGLIMDLVPNHMCVNTNDNEWWNDVLENGPSSPFAKYFDIDWRSPKAELRDKVLLPVLGEQYGKALESGELVLRETAGALSVCYHDRSFPVGPGTYPRVLAGTLRRLRESADAADANGGAAIALLEHIIGRAKSLPGRSETEATRMDERRRSKELVKSALNELLTTSPSARRALDEELRDFNGSKGSPTSFDVLEGLLAEQAYRLSCWRVAADHINYRRFFEVDDLAAIRIEEPEVFEAVHAKAFELLDRGWVSGFRIDHVDGLREPRRYLADIARRAGARYVVVEKILGDGEHLPATWASAGTTGYEFLNAVGGLFVSHTGEASLCAIYDALRTTRGSFEDVAYDAKRLILDSSMSAELSVMARRLDRISEQHRWSRDFTLGTLQRVLGTTVACFPVYRTYLSDDDEEVSPRDAASIRAALDAAKVRGPSLSASAFDFLGDVLLARDPEGLTEVQRVERRDFVLRFQQLTGPVMAKGTEDTAFFRYFPLLSLNEVGGGPAPFGISVAEFHRRMQDRAEMSPGALSATSTHDTKRGEDGRARLNVISEIPAEWAEALTELREIAGPLKPRVSDRPVPDADDEYYVYQTLLGAWPANGVHDDALPGLTARVQGAVEKAVREAKRNSSWIHPNRPYEEALRSFVERILDPDGAFARRLGIFASRIATPGLLTSVAQLVVKATAPGVPDFFQGTELWDFNLVDPDNRRPVDFAKRKRLLDELRPRIESDRASLARELVEDIADGRLKLFVTSALLACRRRNRELFGHGSYQPLAVEGSQGDHVVAFARRWQGRAAVTVTGRFFARLSGKLSHFPPGAWGDTVVRIPSDLSAGSVLTDALSGTRIPRDGPSIPLGRLFETMPFVVLVGEAKPCE
jgi:(1->4)-alpha-D-glucan 1-alpha-D-glucosylmutase